MSGQPGRNPDAGMDARNVPSHPLLESVSNCFQQNRRDRDRKAADLRTRQAIEKAHAQQLRNGVTQQDLARAGIMMNSWAQRQAHSHQMPQLVIPAQPVWTPAIAPVYQIGRVPPSSTTATTVRKPPVKRGAQPLIDVRHIQRPDSQSSCENRHQQRNNDDSVILLDSSIDSSVICLDSSIDDANYVPKNNNSEACHIDDHNNSALTTDRETRADNSSIQEADGANTLNDSATEETSSDASSNGQGSPENANKNSRVCEPSTSSSPPTSEFMCMVLNCQAEFSSDGQLGHHMNLFKHSPCNPCLKARNCKLPPDPLGYICPECNKEYKMSADCRDHMKRRKHCPFYEPLSVGGYICPQCLLIFHSYPACWYHIDKSQHQSVAYQFTDDCGARGVTKGPLGVGEELIHDLIDKCGKVPFSVQCLECLLDIKSAAKLRQHMQETEDQHLVSSLCETTVLDIFASYLATYSCDRCHRLFHTNKTKIHQCAEGYMGRIIESDVCSFADFIKRCALTLRPIDLSSKVVSGTSGISIPLDDGDGSIPVKDDSEIKTSKIPVDVSLTDEHSDSESEQGSVGTFSKRSGVDGSSSSREYVNNKPITIIATTSLPSSSGGGISEPHADTDSETEAIAISRARSDIGFRSSDSIKGDPKPGTSGTTGPSSDVMGQKDKVVVNTDDEDSEAEALFLSDDENSEIELSDSDSDSDCLMVEDVDKHSSPNMDDYSIIDIEDDNDDDDDDDGDETPMSKREAKRRLWAMKKRIKQLNKQKKKRMKQKQMKRKKAQLENANPCKRPRSQSPSGPISDTNLSRMKNIIFLDLDNWPSFFSKLPRCLPDRTFVWGFFGGRNVWSEPVRCHVFNQLKASGNFYLNKRCGHTKDAADFAIVLTVGKYHERLPNNVTFTIMSGDKGFIEVERQMKDAERKTFVIDPHRAHQFSNDMVYAMITSVLEI